MTAEEEAKQLDSVTDMHTDTEFDSSKAQEAMSALTSAGNKDSGAAEVIKVSKDDVAVITAELEVTDEVAEKALREAAMEVGDGNSPLAAALRSLVTS